MKSENPLYDSITEKWFETSKEIYEKHAIVAENNKNVHAKPLAGLINFDERDRAIWESINLLDQLYLESMKEKLLSLKCLITLISAWHENYDKPAMSSASQRFIANEFANEAKSNHAEVAMMDVINNLRQLVLLGRDQERKNT